MATLTSYSHCHHTRHTHIHQLGCKTKKVRQHINKLVLGKLAPTARARLLVFFFLMYDTLQYLIILFYSEDAKSFVHKNLMKCHKAESNTVDDMQE